MATTTNYGWTTPDDTALVKDGAAAIRTLGTSIDTTTKNLNPSTTLGDIEYRSSTANTNTRLGIGSTGQVLTVNSGVPAWVTPASGGMTLISTTTLSGATVAITSIPQTYNTLYILLTGINLAGNADVGFKPLSSSTLVSDIAMILSGGTAQFNNKTSNIGYLFESGLLAGNTNNSLVLKIDNYASTNSYKPLISYGQAIGTGSAQLLCVMGGGILTNSAIDAFDIVALTSTFNGGTMKIYGVK